MSANRRVGVEIFASGAQAKTEFAATKAEIAGIKAEAQAAGPAASAAMNGVGASAKATAAAMGTTSAAAKTTSAALGSVAQGATTTKAAIANYSSEILQARGQMAQMAQQLVDVNARYGRSSEQATLLRGEMVNLGAATRGLVAEKALLVAESKVEEAAVISSTSAWSRKTTMINTGQGALRGYDAAITGVIRSMGGINLGFAVGISLLAALLPKIIELVSAKKQLVDIDKDLVLGDAELARSTGDATRLNADILTGFSNLASAQTTYISNTDKLANSLNILATEGKVVGEVIQADNFAFVVGRKTAGELQDEIVELNKSLHDQEKALEPSIASLRSLHTLYGLNTEQLLAIAEKLHIFTSATEEGARTREFFRQQLEKEPEALKAVAKELENVTGRTMDLADAARIASLAIREIKAPKIDFEAVQGVSGAEDRLNRGLRTLEATGVHDRATQTRSLASEIANVKEQTLREAAAGKSLTEINRGLLIPTKELIAEAGKQDAAYKKLTDTHHAGAGAARSHAAAARGLANALVDLRARARDAEAAITLDSLSLQQFRIADTLQKEREHLEINKRDKVAALELLDQIERSMLAETLRAAAQANKQAQEQSRAQRLRHLEQIERDEKAHSKVLLQVYMDRLQQQDRLDRQDAASKLRGQDFENERKRIEIEREANDEAERAIRIFGRLARSEELLGRQIAVANGQMSEQQAFMTALHSAAEQFVEDWIKSGAIFQAVADGISESLRRMVSNGEDFGANMKAMFLDLVAQLASYFGQLFISMGAGMMFINPAAGIGLIAAGFALMALAGVLGGMADKAHQAAAATGNSAGASAAASGGGSAATGTQRGPKSPIEVDLSGRSAAMGRDATGAAAGGQGAAQVSAQERWLREAESRWSALNGLERFILRQMRANYDSAQRFVGGSSVSPPKSNVTTISLSKEGTREAWREWMERSGVVTLKSARSEHNVPLRKALKTS